jgi:hypothetical protein
MRLTEGRELLLPSADELDTLPGGPAEAVAYGSVAAGGRKDV